MTSTYYAKFDYAAHPVALFRVSGTHGWYLDRVTRGWMDAPWVRTEVDWGNETFFITEERAQQIAKSWGLDIVEVRVEPS